MGYYSDILSGIGAYLGGGFLTVLGGIPIIGTSITGFSFGALPAVLYGVGTVFVAAGVIERFFTSHLKSKAASEDVVAKA